MAGSLKAVKSNFSSTPYVLREVLSLLNVDLFNVDLRIKLCNLPGSTRSGADFAAC